MFLSLKISMSLCVLSPTRGESVPHCSGDIEFSNVFPRSNGADMIVGFPGESEQDFMDTLNLIRDCQITKVHAFPFSPHTMGESVPAGKFANQVPEAIKKERMNQIMELSEQIREQFKEENKGQELHVLIEKSDGSSWSGWTENYLEADQDNCDILEGKIAKNQIIRVRYK